MLRKLKIIPVLLLIFILSLSGVIIITNKANKIDIKEDVVRVVKKIEAGEPLTVRNVKADRISLEWLSGVKYIKPTQSIKGIYAKETLYPGDIVRVERVGSKNQLVARSVEKGFERVSVELDKPWNGANYQYSTGQTVALNCAVDYPTAKYLGEHYKKELLSITEIGQDGQLKGETAVIRVLDKIKIISFCDKEGNVVTDKERENSTNKDIASVTMDVGKQDAFIIHILRNSRGVFEITRVHENIGSNEEDISGER